MFKHIYDYCFGCKRKKFFVKRREVPIPGTNLVAKSREKTCSECYNNVLKAIKEGKQKYERNN